ncbi:sulfite exporter TauE/SafE family protein [Vibrio sp. JC009]|uniref:sulfite exporter TauE/SafE family protein n=1 Tax=Vibrio sp. JC009 TaxID=2912314 RepID=UPI0023B1FF4A|nr:sulfite exporter TauE/SafE family protein [Vibrio sp. JC009]WED23289.1 sulfite exporter TauE/SafE family protein [Vibrio sp. JC009]
MNNDWIGALMIGLLGSAHCVGMCGGIASAVGMSSLSSSGKYLTPVFYNLGRLLSYMLMGLVVGGAIASASQILTGNSALNWLRLLSAVVMIVLALYIGKWWQGLLTVEKAGQHIWKHIAPVTKKLLPLRSPFHALPLGFLWGWLPCGLVYSTLTWAAVSGGALNGALIMFCFGLGTLPSMLLVGFGATHANQLRNSVWFRQIGALILLAYGIYIVVSTAPLL